MLQTKPCTRSIDSDKYHIFILPFSRRNQSFEKWIHSALMMRWTFQLPTWLIRAARRLTDCSPRTWTLSSSSSPLSFLASWSSPQSLVTNHKECKTYSKILFIPLNGWTKLIVHCQWKERSTIFAHVVCLELKLIFLVFSSNFAVPTFLSRNLKTNLWL